MLVKFEYSHGNIQKTKGFMGAKKEEDEICIHDTCGKCNRPDCSNTYICLWRNKLPAGYSTTEVHKMSKGSGNKQPKTRN